MLKRMISVVLGIVTLAIVGFAIVFVIGLYTAMDSVAKPYAAASATSQTAAETDMASAGAQGMRSRDDKAADTGFATEDDTPASQKSDEADNGNTVGLSVPASLSQGLAAQAPQASVAPASTQPLPSVQNAPSAGGSATPSEPAGQQKVWHEPVYETVHHEAVYATAHHDAEYTTITEYFTVCHQCPFKIQGSIYPHLDATGHTGYNSDVPFTSQVLVCAAYDEQILVSAAYDEQVLVRAGYWG
jgi:hypothetical protein